ncbi:helix-turn-helix domain-containing protein [Levilactobacillus fujinensis]|uniref:Helix-turn-helix domain-containing protein n=1 Tax=Levilactobacillus fujinensis TaxID=2486024 RepID=A0ABW1TIV4_9LACO|nr:helix-turn-helix transcriptional regulator [Levilactobacillus fujinensis]
MTEQNLAEGMEAIYAQIKIALFKKHMSQIELADLIGEGPQQLSRAIHGDMQPKSKEIRQKVYRFLDIKQ